MNKENSGGEPVTPKLDEEGNPIPDNSGNQGGGGSSSGSGDGAGDGDSDSSGDSDPLDAIEDEETRAEAKKARAIARRIAKGERVDKDGNPIEDSPQPAADDANATPAATKADLELMTLNAARKSVPQEVQDVWDELKTVPLGGFDPLDTDSVAQNMVKRYNLYRMDNPVDPENPAAPLSTSPRVPTAGGGNKRPESTGESKELPGFKEPVQPDQWYPPTEGEGK